MQTAAMAGRRIAIAYTSFGVGRGLMQFAKEKVLTHNDTVYICHVFQQQNPVSVGGVGWRGEGRGGADNGGMWGKEWRMARVSKCHLLLPKAPAHLAAI
jgi:hypothetical protein